MAELNKEQILTIKDKVVNVAKKVAGTQDISNLNQENIKKNNKIIQQKEFEAQQKADKKKLEFSKRLVLFITVNAELQIWASYVLGFMGHEQIAETLSVTVVKTVIYVVICYLIRALIEGLSKHTTMFGTNLPFPNATSADALIDSIDEQNPVDFVDNISSSDDSSDVG